MQKTIQPAVIFIQRHINLGEFQNFFWRIQTVLVLLVDFNFFFGAQSVSRCDVIIFLRGSKLNECIYFPNCVWNISVCVTVWIHVWICASKSQLSLGSAIHEWVWAAEWRAADHRWRLDCKLGHRWNIADSQLQPTKRCRQIFIDPCRTEFANSDAFMTNGENWVTTFQRGKVKAESSSFLELED